MKFTFPYLRQLTIISIFVATFFLPLKTSISNIGLIGVIISTLIAFLTKGISTENKFSSFIFYSPTVFFIPLIWGITYSFSKEEAFSEMTKYIFLALVPLFIFRKDISTAYYKKYASYGILIGSIASTFILSSINIYNFSQTTYPFHWLLNNTFTGFNFLSPFENLHPIYVGMYYNIAIAVLLFSIVKLNNFIRIFLALILIIGILFLASRITYLILFLIIGLYLIHNLSFKIFSLLVTVAIIIGALSFSTFQKTYVYHKLVTGTIFDLNDNIGEYNTNNTFKVDSRYSRWKVALELIEEKPLLGYGGGTENEMLLKKYKEYNMKNSIERRYNAHNQFLGFFLRFGVLGFVLLLVYFISNTITAIKYQHLLFLAFLTILFWSFMVENIMDRNMGINFVALFGTLFYAEFLTANEKKHV
ncbi:O-antigen ligase family protein [Mesonia maritima]|uniref:O-antigen ligase n=1 Tax=Mesonia maritima TaxID=1793873 RepID=A0ABU1K2I2_9FLAO|nr:O-antigen ligase family protein [Mesonia maritima]MDR6299819.1 O-antigen ligase [Mesonia maritima]